MQNFKCFYCDTDLIWQNDFETDDFDETERLSHFYICPNCDRLYLITEPAENEKETAD